MCRRMRHLKPREIQGCQLALDASIPTSLYDATSGGSLVAADAGVARWEDQSGSARHMTQATSGNRPLRRLAGLSGGASLDFDGSNDRLEYGTLNITSLYDGAGTSTFVIAVLSQRAAKAQNTIFSSGTSATNRINVHASYDNVLYFDPGASSSAGRISVAQPSGWDDAAHVFAGVRTGANGFISVDNKVLATKSNFTHTVSSATVTLSIGGLTADLTAYHSGHVSEISEWSISANNSVVNRMMHSRQRKWRING